MKMVYVCSAFTGDIFKNIENAILYSREIYRKGYLPMCVHIYLEKATGLSEENGDRKELLRLGIEMLKRCDECWVFGRISEGMRREIDYSYVKKIPVKFMSIKNEETKLHN